MVQEDNMSRTPSTSTQEIQMDMFDHHGSHTQGKYAKRKSRFKRSDGSTSSDTTSNSFVRQADVLIDSKKRCVAAKPAEVINQPVVLLASQRVWLSIKPVFHSLAAIRSALHGFGAGVESFSWLSEDWQAGVFDHSFKWQLHNRASPRISFYTMVAPDAAQKLL
ncbi:hypothetical protein DNTS_007298 [Danionella cerebrum]|uniref:Uncharacterized protein n=1 Tax=Danionella cerebrum TaxID=2873325 RepID=A0A553R310_9TELE|nr:hypothetical protein DNTS_007298 [Danionella translucida]